MKKSILFIMLVTFMSCASYEYVTINTPEPIAKKYGNVPTTGYTQYIMHPDYKGLRNYFIIDSLGDVRHIISNQDTIYRDYLMIINE